MSNCFVKEGACNSEILIKAKKISQVKIALEFETSCKYIDRLGQLLKEINIGEALSSPMLDTEIYKNAAKCCCRNSCMVPAAIFKVIEVESGTFLPKSVNIEFINKI